MADWHGYPQHPDAHPERPWWRCDKPWPDFPVKAVGFPHKGSWFRMGGAQFPHHLDDIERIDREHPRPRPAYLSQQVWVWGETDGPMGGRREGETVCIGRRGPNGWLWSNGQPPDDAVLAYGPGAPWAPPGGE